MYAPRGLKIASRLLQVGYLSQFGSNLSPSWLQVGSSWAHVGPKLATSENHPQNDMPYPSSWPQVGSMLAPCWLHVGSCWLHVGSCWTKWPPRWLKMPLCWLRLASRWPTWPPTANFDQFLIKNCSFWNTLDPQNIKKAMVLKVRLHFALFCFS